MYAYISNRFNLFVNIHVYRNKRSCTVIKPEYLNSQQDECSTVPTNYNYNFFHNENEINIDIPPRISIKILHLQNEMEEESSRDSIIELLNKFP